MYIFITSIYVVRRASCALRGGWGSVGRGRVVSSSTTNTTTTSRSTSTSTSNIPGKGRTPVLVVSVVVVVGFRRVVDAFGRVVVACLLSLLPAAVA